VCLCCCCCCWYLKERFGRSKGSRSGTRGAPNFFPRTNAFKGISPPQVGKAGPTPKLFALDGGLYVSNQAEEGTLASLSQESQALRWWSQMGGAPCSTPAAEECSVAGFPTADASSTLTSSCTTIQGFWPRTTDFGRRYSTPTPFAILAHEGSDYLRANTKTFKVFKQHQRWTFQDKGVYLVQAQRVYAQRSFRNGNRTTHTPCSSPSMTLNTARGGPLLANSLLIKGTIRQKIFQFFLYI
jgi:hypothetical protein